MCLFDVKDADGMRMDFAIAHGLLTDFGRQFLQWRETLDF